MKLIENTNLDEPFLDCYIFSVTSLAETSDRYHLVEEIYHYNSLASKQLSYSQYCIQIPENEIQDKHLLDGLDYELVNKHRIPLIKRIVNFKDEQWKVDLKYYEDYKLQSSNIS